MKSDGIFSFMNTYSQVLKTTQPVIENFATTVALKEMSYASEILRSMKTIQPNYIQQMTELMGLAKEITPHIPSVELQNSISSILSATASIQKPLASDVWFATATHLQSTMSLMNKVITPGITSALSSLADRNIDASYLMGFKLDEITCVGDNLVYDGREFGEEELKEECKREIEAIKNDNPLERIKNKYWVLFLILLILWNIPDIPEKLEFYKDSYKQIVQNIKTKEMSKKQYLHVVKENAFIRDEANSKSNIVIKVTYSEQLEVIDEVPYWYNVKYNTGEKEYTGWISKISLGTEDYIND